MKDSLHIIVAVTGASGSIYAKHLFDELRNLRWTRQVEKVDAVFSEKAKEVWKHEIGDFPDDFPFTIYDNDDFNAPFASGSSLYDAMFVCPCSMGTLGKIASGISDTLIARAADVMLKERRQLILSVRETPLNLIHVNNMQTLTQAGAIIAPASPSFYSHPKTVDELAMTVVDRLLQLAGAKEGRHRWGEAL